MAAPYRTAFPATIPRSLHQRGQARYPDRAIELVLMLRLVFHLALRQAEGFAASVLRLLRLDLDVPDRTTSSRRSRGFADHRPRVAPHEPRHLVIDGTGLKLLGRGEWDAERHGRARRAWRKLHLAVDAGTGEIAAHVLTAGNADDAAQVPALLGQAGGTIASVTADGAYDGEPTCAAVASRRLHPPPDVVIPPRSPAVPSTDETEGQGARDRHTRLRAERGRMARQRATGYGRRHHAETAVGRDKHQIGPSRAPAACLAGRPRRPPPSGCSIA